MSTTTHCTTTSIDQKAHQKSKSNIYLLDPPHNSVELSTQNLAKHARHLRAILKAIPRRKTHPEKPPSIHGTSMTTFRADEKCSTLTLHDVVLWSFHYQPRDSLVVSMESMVDHVNYLDSLSNDLCLLTFDILVLPRNDRKSMWTVRDSIERFYFNKWCLIELIIFSFRS